MLGGFITALVAACIVLLTFFTNLNIFSDMAAQGFGPWINNFLTHITAQKVLFYIAAALFAVGVVLYLRGRKKAKKEGDPTPFVPVAIKKYFRDIKGEFKKIVWPTLPAVVRNTGVTLAVCVLLGAVICLVDAGLGALINLLLKIGG